MAIKKKLNLITVVVQHKHGNEVVDAALKAGATGATYYYAQGTGVRQELGAEGEEIEVGKRVIAIITEPARTDKVLAAVVAAGKLEVPGQGVAYVQEVTQAVGFRQP